MTAARAVPALVVLLTDECQELAAAAPGGPGAAEVARVIRMGRAASVTVASCYSRPDSRPLRPACPCPDHPGRNLLPLGGGAARGMCPVDGRSYQLYPPEVSP
jgi:hypothetical protein